MIGTNRLPQVERALIEAVRLMSFGGGSKPSPIKVEVLRLLAACLEVLAGRAQEVPLRAPSSIFGCPRDGERRTVRAALERCSWNQSQAARELGLKLPTLRDRIKALGLRLPERECRRFSRDELTAALKRAGGNKTRAAQELGLNRVTFGRQLERQLGKEQDDASPSSGNTGKP
jgi:DNA-binding NtrC family response regulator